VKAFNSSDRGIDKFVSMGEQFFTFYLKNSKYFDLNIHFERKYYALHKPPTRKHHGDFIVQCQKVIDQLSDITIEAIRIGMEDGSIKLHADPKHLMLLHWGEALGIIQVALMRRKYFKDVYELTMDTFLAHFRSSVVTYLTQGAK
jgi:hypothetical protein